MCLNVLVTLRNNTIYCGMFSIPKQFSGKGRFVAFIIITIIIFVLLQNTWLLRNTNYKRRDASYVTLCNERLTGNHRTGNHLFMLSALLDFAVKTQREIILPVKGWVLDKVFDFNLKQYRIGGLELKINRYENRSSICPCERIQNPHYDYDKRFDQSQFLEKYSSKTVSGSKSNIEICGLSQTYLHASNPEVADRLSSLPMMLKDGAFDKAFEIIKLFRLLMLKNKLNLFALYSYNELKDNLTSSNRLKSYSDELKSNNLSEVPFVVGVHVRMGDFLSAQEVKYGLTVADGEYFRHSFEYFIKAHKKVIFVVLSDDMDWITKHFPKYFLTENSTSSTFDTTNVKIVFFRDSLPQDIAFLCRTDGLIMSTGTFGWWVGWFNTQATVIYYDDFPKKNSKLGTLLDKKKFYLKHWIPML